MSGCDWLPNQGASTAYRGGKNFVDMITLRINYRFGWGAARLNLARRN
jgi:hypothetical protein